MPDLLHILPADPKASYLPYKLEIDRAVSRAFQSGLYILGPEVVSFEQEFAGYLGVADAIGVGSGTGGALVIDNPEWAARARMLRQYGWRQRYVSELAGMNTRLDEVQAAVLRVKLICLPVHPQLTDSQVAEVAEHVVAWTRTSGDRARS